ncbi:hypothetical protein [Novosphingobium sp. KN65.2]|uniref:hypothetical protein n=1 Tax=Novosphingobium sp. KN65.2 TaxID=1478134 RepID=UPI0012E24DEC|nr:hypothetical protein [Novosphingobium sp. KN65.2]
MSNMSQHYHEIQQSDDYRFGWESAERGEPRPDWKPLPGPQSERLERQKLGWDDFHQQGKAFP